MYRFRASIVYGRAKRLVTTLGFKTLVKVFTKRKLHSGYLFGKGKLKEIAQWTGGPGEVFGFNQEPEDDIDEMVFSTSQISKNLRWRLWLSLTVS